MGYTPYLVYVIEVRAIAANLNDAYQGYKSDPQLFDGIKEYLANLMAQDLIPSPARPGGRGAGPCPLGAVRLVPLCSEVPSEGPDRGQGPR